MKVSVTELRRTVGDPNWLGAHKDEVLKTIPSTWVSAQDILLPFGFHLKLQGCNWRETEDLVVALQWFCNLGLVEARQDPHSAPGPRSLIIRRKP